jgi:hypothetical protein
MSSPIDHNDRACRLLQQYVLRQVKEDKNFSELSYAARKAIEEGADP